jgi:hypothetical protein
LPGRLSGVVYQRAYYDNIMNIVAMTAIGRVDLSQVFPETFQYFRPDPPDNAGRARTGSAWT